MNAKFQTNFDVISLYDKTVALPAVTKVGIVPFILPSMKIMVMKPKAEAKHLGEPSFQIAKGTRRIYINENWCDMREDDLRYADESFHETLIGTALREGQEEIGLKSTNIKRLFDMGGFTFVSASRGVVKPLHLFAAEIADENDFSEFEATTGEARWMTPEEFMAEGRADHAAIIQKLSDRLTQFFTGI
jgi:hypothetical protein